MEQNFLGNYSDVVHSIAIDYEAGTLTNDPAVQGDGPFLPLWQTTPAGTTPKILNFNAMSHPSAQQGYREVLRSGKAVLDIADNHDKKTYGNNAEVVQMLLSLGQYRDVADELCGEPST